MPITTVQQDPEALTLTVVGDFPVSRQRLWEAWLDPRQLERFWGPPTWPATFTRHEVFPGGRSDYVMTGPDGSTAAGYWEFVAVDPGRSFEVLDGFADAAGTADDSLPRTRMTITFTETDTGSAFTAVSRFASLAELEQLVGMGMVEGMNAALAQLDDVLADLRSFAADLATATQILSETKVRISRVVRGSVEQVWHAHHDPDLLRRWLLGPDGWRMTVCEVAENVGESYRQEWASDNGEPGFGFTGELLSSSPPYQEVTTEAMIGMEGEPTRNELTLAAVDGGTLLSLVITYPSAQVRDMVLATGMTDGMEASYQRLEREVLATV